MQVNAAIIAGTGVGHRLNALPGRSVHIPTPYGLVRGRLIQSGSGELLALSRHSAGHSVPPHKVNYLATASALEALGVRACLATAAVGGINPEWQVGELVLCQGFIDLSARRITAFSDTVEHRDFTEPFSNRLSQLVLESAIKQGVTICEGGIYANLDGPRYETPQEIEALKVLGANVVGMTAASEAIVMRELNVPYACVCVVTNAAAGIQGDALNHQEVVEVMEMKGKVLLDLLLNTARSIGADWE